MGLWCRLECALNVLVVSQYTRVLSVFIILKIVLVLVNTCSSIRCQALKGFVAVLDAQTAIASPRIENWVEEGLGEVALRLLGSYSGSRFMDVLCGGSVVFYSASPSRFDLNSPPSWVGVASVFERTTRLLGEPRMRDQSVGRSVPIACHSLVSL